MKFKFLFLSAALCLTTMAFAQNAECDADISVYREAFKQWDGKASTVNPVMVEAWRRVFLNCPGYKERTLTDGTKIVNNALIRNTKDAALKEKYIDTLVMVYEARVQYFPQTKAGNQVGNIKGRMGLDLMAFPSRLEQSYLALKDAIDIEGNNSASNFIDGYFMQIINMAKAGKLDEAVIIEEYSRLMDIVDYNINTKYAEGSTEKDREKQYANYVQTKNNLEGAVQPYANCEDLVRIYQKKYDAEPDNVELLNKIASTLAARNCDKSDLYLAVAIKLHKLNPSPESAYFIGKRYLVDQEYGKAVSYLLEATKSTDNQSAQQAYKYLAQIMLKEGNWEQGRTYARKAIELNKNDGEPYMIIGYLYASSGKDCNVNPLHAKAVYWAAVDKFQRAKEVDPSMASKANEMIREYSKLFPTSEDAFFYNVFEGDDYQVECWINEKTKARFSNN
ncbi:MAG: hypothetical protein J5708_08405 [Bacteroidales bacterium]|nr:hypothetical protein [Bacteroidales bacterium]